MADADIAKIEARRQALKIPATSLCAAANIALRTYQDGRIGRKQPRPATLARLNTALHRFSIGFGAEAGALAPGAAYRACLVLAAFVTGTEPSAVLASNPKKRATLVPAWREAAQVRRVGLYIANQFLGFSQADLGRAAGITRSAVHTALKELYDARDRDAQLAAVLTRLEEIFES